MNNVGHPIVDFDSPDFDESPQWTEDNFARASPASEILPPHVAAALVRKRGPQDAPTKRHVTLRLDEDILAKFRATGRGWQSRINAVLKAAQP